MSLLLVRVDDRLVHGQVMVGWRHFLDADTVLVASDRMATNPMGSAVLRMTAPSEVTLVIDGVASLTRRLISGEFKGKNAILLFENLTDLISALKAGLKFEHLNLGGVRHRGSCIAFAPSVYLTPEDIEALIGIIKRGVAIDVQMVPRAKPPPLDLEVLGKCLRR